MLDVSKIRSLDIGCLDFCVIGRRGLVVPQVQTSYVVGPTLMWPQTWLGLIKEMRSSQASIRCNPFPYFTNKTFVASRKQVYIEDPMRNL